MGILLILIGVIANQFESMLVKRYGQKYGKGGMFFNSIMCFAATIYFFLTDKGGLHFTKEILVYGIINAFMYGAGFYSGYLAYKSGAFGLTTLFTSFGVIIPAFYGIIFLKEAVTFFTAIAFLMILISLYLINYQKDTNKTGNKKISLKWIISVIFIVVSNSTITIIGKMQYEVCGDTYSNEFLILSLFGSALLLLLLGFILERKNFRLVMKRGIPYGVAAGVSNGICNLLLLITYNYLPISVASPVRSGCSIVISFLLSIFLYREALTIRQLIGVIFGGIAVVLMSV